jgi:NAD+ kinase
MEHLTGMVLGVVFWVFVGAVVLVPICPHTLTNRPLVIGSNARVEIDVASDNAGDARVTADGNPLPNLAPGDRIRITRHVDSVRLIHPSGHDHFATLRAKLHWGRSPC